MLRSKAVDDDDDSDDDAITAHRMVSKHDISTVRIWKCFFFSCHEESVQHLM